MIFELYEESQEVCMLLGTGYERSVFFRPEGIQPRQI
jgi:hypothetical protein